MNIKTLWMHIKNLISRVLYYARIDYKLTFLRNLMKIILVQIYKVLRNELQALRGCSTHLNEQESPSQHMSRNQ
jgi:hypothetical protein